MSSLLITLDQRSAVGHHVATIKPGLVCLGVAEIYRMCVEQFQVLATRYYV